ncbi:hypothetical protein ACWGDT_20800 [Streptomyces avermitilis]
MVSASIPAAALTPNAAGTVEQNAGVPNAVSSLRVLVVGQGYVGLPLAVRAAQVGHCVVGFDTDVRRAAALACGSSPVEDITAVQLGPLLRSGSYHPTASPDEAVGVRRGGDRGADAAV